MKINVNQAINDSEKVESLPNKVGIGRGVLKEFGGKLGSVWDKRRGRRNDPYYDLREKVMRSSIGMNWNEVVELLKSKVPTDYIQEHPWFIEKPDVMIQNSVTGYWHWQDRWGRLSPYGYETPKELKHSGWNRNEYYLDIQNRLKVLPARKSYHKYSPSKSEKRQEKTEQNLINHLWNIADYKRKFQKSDYIEYKNMTDPSKTESYYREPKFRFQHPFKNVEGRKWDKESNQWIPNGIFEPIQLTLSINQFKLWCEKYNKTYFFIIDNKYVTNLKWSFKQ